MGYAYYTLPDGREAGYGVEATCDFPGCDEKIDRGLSYLCGESPNGFRDPEEPGCGNYFCPAHIAENNHNCTNPTCSEYSLETFDRASFKGCNYWCGLVRDHDGQHFDPYEKHFFTEVETDEE